nr:hypothetical protein [Tanacetum cinerariifolium]
LVVVGGDDADEGGDVVVYGCSEVVVGDGAGCGGSGWRW